MTLVRRLMLVGAAAGAVALVIAYSATRPEETHAQTEPATFYGTVDPGETVEAFIDGVLCETDIANSDGIWIMQVPADAPCSPEDGDTVTFKRSGQEMAATETWKPQGAPADVADGVPGDLASGATPTPTLTPVQGQTETVIDRTLDVTTDAKVVDGVEVLQATSADETITATIPIAAVPDTTSVALKIDTTAAEDLAPENPIPAGTSLANDEAVGIIIINTQGDPITQFAADLTFTVTDIPPSIAPAEIGVFSLIGTQWVPLDGDDFDVALDGTVTFMTDHLTLFAILKMPTITFQLAAGLTSLTFTGPSGTEAASIASEIGGSLETLLFFDAPSQTWQTFLPAAPPQVNTLQKLNQRDALIVRMKSGPVAWTETDIIPEPGGTRTVTLIPGLNPIGFTGDNATEIATLLAPVAAAVESATRFDSTTQTWQTYLPAAPPQVNTLSTLDRLDVVYIRVKGAAQQPWLLPDTAPEG